MLTEYFEWVGSFAPRHLSRFWGRCSGFLFEGITAALEKGHSFLMVFASGENWGSVVLACG